MEAIWSLNLEIKNATGQKEKPHKKLTRARLCLLLLLEIIFQTHFSSPKQGLTMTSVRNSYIVLGAYPACVLGALSANDFLSFSPYCQTIVFSPSDHFFSLRFKRIKSLFSVSLCLFPSLRISELLRFLSPPPVCPAVPHTPTSLPPPNKSTTVPLWTQSFHSPQLPQSLNE